MPTQKQVDEVVELFEDAPYLPAQTGPVRSSAPAIKAERTGPMTTSTEAKGRYENFQRSPNARSMCGTRIRG
jgi:hypothetical protein